MRHPVLFNLAEWSFDVPAQQLDAQVLREQRQPLRPLREKVELALPRYLPSEVKQAGKSV